MIEIKVDDREVNKRLARIGRKTGNMSGALKVIGERMLRHTDDRFVRQQDPDGKPWSPLRPSTRAQKRNPRILEERGHLRGSIRYQVDGNVLRVGTNLPYGPTHQLGGKAHDIKPKRKKALAWPGAKHPVKKVRHPGVPARAYLGMGPEDKKDILEVLGDYLEVK